MINSKLSKILYAYTHIYYSIIPICIIIQGLQKQNKYCYYF